MGSVAMTGSDSLKINNRIFANLADGDAVVVTFPNEIAAVKTGKNGNALFALNESGRQAEMVIRVVRGSDDDKYLNSLLAQQGADFASFITINSEMVKRVGDGSGQVSADTYVGNGGIFGKRPEAKSNQEGDTSQSVTEWHLKFSNMARVIT